jgi:anaerobic selenocysteine-containing dehydrogenase
MLGANPLASNGSLMTAAGIEGRLKAIQKRGGKVVVIDPRRTETAGLADEHHFIQPGADVLLLLAFVHTLLDEELAGPGRLAAFVDGQPELWPLVEPYTPEAVSQATGIGPETIRRLAQELAGAETAVIYGRIGVSTQQFGGLCHWLISVLNILTGNLDRPGGAMFPTPAIDIVDASRAGKMGRWQSRVRGLPEFAGELPVAAFAEEILTPGEGQIRAMVTIAGNPVLSTPNGRQLDEALASLDYMVAIDIYLNETTRHANIILPPTTGLETEHYDIAFHALAVRNSAKYSPALYEPTADHRHDWQIYRALVEHLATQERPHNPENPLNQMTPAVMLDLGLQLGPYGKEGLTLARLQEEVHGVDLGPMKSQLPERLFTAGKRIQLLPAPMVADLERVQQTFFNGRPESNGYDLTLIGRRHLRSNNSWMHNSERLVRGKERCTLLMHPADAAQRGLNNGQSVSVESAVGSVKVPLEINEDIMPGVVSIPHGWGHNRPGIRLQTAQANAGVSINDLTDERALDVLTGNAALVGVRVCVAGSP